MIAFLFTKTGMDYKTRAIADFNLDWWIDSVVNGKRFIKIDANDVPSFGLLARCDPHKIVVVGDEAFNIMQEEFPTIQCFKLPDPSPLNGFLNNDVQVEAVLEECKKWLQ